MNIRHILGALVCAIKRKHKRGKMIESVQAQGLPEKRTYQCARCGAKHSRRIKPALGTVDTTKGEE